eukprot:2689891-Pleurochrysis_carterae.AAC.4
MQGSRVGATVPIRFLFVRSIGPPRSYRSSARCSPVKPGWKMPAYLFCDHIHIFMCTTLASQTRPALLYKVLARQQVSRLQMNVSYPACFTSDRLVSMPWGMRHVA